MTDVTDARVVDGTVSRTVSLMSSTSEPHEDPTPTDGPPCQEMVDGELYAELDPQFATHAEDAMRLLVDRALGDYWLVEGPAMAKVLCAASLKGRLPPPPPEAAQLLEQMRAGYAAELAELGASWAADGELSPLTLVRMMATDAAQEALPAPLWVPVYALGGAYRDIAALLLCSDVLAASAVSGPAPPALVDLIDCVTTDLLHMLCGCELPAEESGVSAVASDAAEQDYLVGRLRGFAELLGSCAQLCALCARVVSGCRELAGEVDRVSGCEECIDALTCVGDELADDDLADDELADELADDEFLADGAEGELR